MPESDSAPASISWFRLLRPSDTRRVRSPLSRDEGDSRPESSARSSSSEVEGAGGAVGENVEARAGVCSGGWTAPDERKGEEGRWGAPRPRAGRADAVSLEALTDGRASADCPGTTGCGEESGDAAGSGGFTSSGLVTTGGSWQFDSGPTLRAGWLQIEALLVASN